MAFNPIPVAGITQVPLPRGRLLDIAGDIQVSTAGTGTRVVDTRWTGGITWTPEPCIPLYTMDVDVCARVDYVNTPRVCEPAITQTAFAVYDAFKGATLEFEASDIEALLDNRITRRLSAAFGSELLSGAASGDRALSKSAHAPFQRTLASAAAPIWYVLTVLEDDLGRSLQGGTGMIHLPPGLLGQAKTTYGLMLNGEGQWETPLGNIVVVDAGYIDSPQPTGGGGPSPIGSDWVYASGPVRYRMTAPKAVDDGNIGSTMTNFTGREDLRSADFTGFRTHDDMVRFMDVKGILQFDPCPVTAALASYEQTDIV